MCFRSMCTNDKTNEYKENRRYDIFFLGSSPVLFFFFFLGSSPVLFYFFHFFVKNRKCQVRRRRTWHESPANQKAKNQNQVMLDDDDRDVDAHRQRHSDELNGEQTLTYMNNTERSV